MNSIAPFPDPLRLHLSEAGEEEFELLLSLLEDDPQSFALVIVRSDFDTETRDALLEHLRGELAPVTLHTIPLSSEVFDVPLLLAQAQTEMKGEAVIAITGLEETPQIAFEPGEKVTRPPAVALLNHGREAIRRVARPLLLWCDPLAYASLREHAPDFFDHYTGLFTFLDASPAPMAVLPSTEPPVFESDLLLESRLRMSSALSPRVTSPATRRFYEDQIETLTEPIVDRARALLGLADAIFSAPLDNASIAQVERAEAAVHEALKIFEGAHLSFEGARCHALLAMLLKRKNRILGIENPVTDTEVQRQIAQALEVFTEKDSPVEWAALMWMQADDALQKGVSEAMLRRALPFIQAAQRVYTLQKYPLLWASCERDMGNIYANLPFTRSHHKKAVSHFEAASRAFRQLNQPSEYALNQMMLGDAFSAAEKETRDNNERAKLLRRALDSYAKAQHIYEQLHRPQHVALMLTLQAMVWPRLPTGNRRQHLRQSANAWLQAAELLGKEEVMQKALSLQRAGDVLLELGQLTKMSTEIAEARDALGAARTAFEQVGQEESAHMCAELVHNLDRILRESAPKSYIQIPHLMLKPSDI